MGKACRFSANNAPPARVIAPSWPPPPRQLSSAEFTTASTSASTTFPAETTNSPYFKAWRDRGTRLSTNPPSGELGLIVSTRNSSDSTRCILAEEVQRMGASVTTWEAHRSGMVQARCCFLWPTLWCGRGSLYPLRAASLIRLLPEHYV